MEGDLVYVVIENFIKRLEMYSLDDWILGIKNVKQIFLKYVVYEIKYLIILDFKECVFFVVLNRKKDINGDFVYWNRIYLF